jgi:AraC-like DNA-binding protein
MNYLTYKPPESLKDFIQFFWVFETNASSSNPYIHSATASACAKLAFQYCGTMEVQLPSEQIDKLFFSGIEAQTQKFQRFVATQNIGIFGIYFYPYALPYLFSIPAQELSNQNIELSSLLGRQGIELEEQVISAKSTLERIKIVSLFFEKRLSTLFIDEPAIISTINHIIQMKGMVNIEDLLERNFLSQRQFERNFKMVSGFSPKMFSRIIRFENSIDLFLMRNISLTEVAYKFGYYDQSHFIRDFKEFSGQHPKAYFSQDMSLFASV